jgi:hypothetical protein
VLPCTVEIALIRRLTSQGALGSASHLACYLLRDLQVTVFQQEHYLENFVQATFDALPEDKLTGNPAIFPSTP